MTVIPAVGSTVGRYELVRVLGRGGMGVVYEARDPVLKRSVALKIVLPNLADTTDFQIRFEREAGVLARVPSRHIVDIYEYGEHDGVIYLVTSYVPDGDLQDQLTQRGPLDVEASLQLVVQLAEALQDAHEAGIVHRDVKPSNVLLRRRGTALVPYLCDFGIATEGSDGLTATGTVIGSVRYMAPERHEGAPIDARSDIYSLGCVLHASITGDAPYSGSDFQIMSAHLYSPIPEIGRGGPHDWLVNGLLRQALAKRPDDRFQSAAAFGNAAEQVLRAVRAR